MLSHSADSSATFSMGRYLSDVVKTLANHGAGSERECYAMAAAATGSAPPSLLSVPELPRGTDLSEADVFLLPYRITAMEVYSVITKIDILPGDLPAADLAVRQKVIAGLLAALQDPKVQAMIRTAQCGRYSNQNDCVSDLANNIIFVGTRTLILLQTETNTAGKIPLSLLVLVLLLAAVFALGVCVGGRK